MDFEIDWSINALPPRPIITALTSDTELIYATANGDITVVSDNGLAKITTAPFEDKVIEFLAADGSYLYASHVSLNGSRNELSVYYRETGALKEQKLLPLINFLIQISTNPPVKMENQS